MRWLSLLAFAATTVILADEPQVRVVEGQVSDQKGKPIHGAFIEWGFFTSDRDDREIVRTDHEGKYRIETTKVGPDYRLGVSSAGFAPQWIDGLVPKLAPDELTHNFKLGRAVEVRGTVIDEHGKPLAGVTLIAQSASTGFHSSFSSPTPSFPFPGPQREGTTNASGEFVIRNLPTTPSVDQKHQGHAFALSIKTPTGRMSGKTVHTTEEIQLKVRRSYLSEPDDRKGELLGEVLDEDSGDPVTHFKVVVRHRPEMIELVHPDGHFRLDKLSLGRPYQFLIYADNYAPFVLRPTAGEPGKSDRHQCNLQRSPGLSGIVVDSSGDPIKDAEIVVGVAKSKHNANRFYWGSFKKLVDGYMGLETVQRMTTGGDGRFKFSQGEQQGVLGIMAPGHARRFVPVAERKELMQDGQLRITLQPEAVLSGIVLLNGQPEPNANIRLSRTSLWEIDFGEIRADQDGKFKIGGLAADTYSLSVYQYSGNTGTVRLSQRLELKVGEKADITMDAPGGNCMVSGSTLPFSLITLSQNDPNQQNATGYQHIGTKADPEGHYRIGGLHPGKYKIRSLNPSTRHGFHHQGGTAELEVIGNTAYDFASPFATFDGEQKPK